MEAGVLARLLFFLFWFSNFRGIFRLRQALTRGADRNRTVRQSKIVYTYPKW
jgi:hypothetical protein